jgi:hypothetical protein
MTSFDEAGPFALCVALTTAIGNMLKASPLPDWMIPFALLPVGAACGWVLMGGNADAVIRGLLSVAVAVYSHQAVKQAVDHE